jgi:hypothetical protein
LVSDYSVSRSVPWSTGVSLIQSSQSFTYGKWSANPIGPQIMSPQHTLSADAACSLADLGAVASSHLNSSNGELLPDFVHRDEMRHRGRDQQQSYEANDLPGAHSTADTTWSGARNAVHGAGPS